MALELNFLIEGREPDPELVVVSGTVEEALNACTRIILKCASPKDNIDPDQLVGKKTLVKLADQRDKSQTNRFEGIVDRFHRTASPLGSQAVFRYELVIRSSLWQLGYALSSRVFRDKSVPQLVEDMLNGHNLFRDQDYAFKLINESQYPRLEHAVQINATDLSFMTDQLAQVGINYYLAPQQPGDNPEFLILCDHHSFFQNCYDDPVTYHPDGGFFTDRRYVTSFRLTKRVMPGKVSLQGYDSSNAHKLMEDSKNINGGKNPEVTFFEGIQNPDRHPKQLAKIREEEILSRLQDGQGESNLFRFRAGTKFTLNKDPLGKDGAKYLLTKVRHSFSRGQAYALSGDNAAPVYSNSFHFVEDETPVRPQFITHWLPQTQGR